jgi:hypothetical protein
MGHRRTNLTFQGLSPTRRAVARGENSPSHLPPRTSRGANPRRPASGYRPNPRVRSKARSATAGGSKRIGLQNLHFLVWHQGFGWRSRAGPPLQAFAPPEETTGGSRGRERCRPIAWTIRKSCPGLRRMISRTTAPSGASPRPRAPRGGRHACKSTRRPRPRFSRAKAGVGERFDSTP